MHIVHIHVFEMARNKKKQNSYWGAPLNGPIIKRRIFPNTVPFPEFVVCIVQGLSPLVNQINVSKSFVINNTL